MHKILTLVAMAVVAGSTFVSAAFAQQVRSAPERDRPTATQLVAYDDARIARLKADLRLNKNQEGDWGKFETALKDVAKDRADRFIAWWDERDKRPAAAAATPTLAEHLRRRADAMTKHAADLKKLADASEPLLEKLDDTQKRRASEFIQQYAASPVPVRDNRTTSERRRSWFW